MGQKVHPYGFRLGIIRDWKSQWFADKKTYPDLLLEDVRVRKYIKKTLSQAAISDVIIERSSNKMRIIIHSARPGVIIGRRGVEIDRLKEDLQGITKKEVLIDIAEVKTPNINGQLVAENIAFQLEKRIPYRRAMKKAVQAAMSNGAGGIKIICSGRLAGAEIARRESYKEGKVPLHTLKADIDYGFAEALTTYGLIGVKVWIYKGEIINKRRGSAKDGVDAKKG